MELNSILFAGALAGSLASALNGLAWGMIAPSRLLSDNVAAIPWRPQHFSLQLSTLLVHLLAGIALSLLFWLSWGLTAIITVPWWVRGLSFALLCWVALCLPLLATQLLSARLSWILISKSALDWLITCISVGLACAWNWAKGIYG